MALDFVRKRQGARAYLDRLPQPTRRSSDLNRRGLGPAITIWPSFLPLRQGITLRRTEQEFTAGAFDEQRVDEASAAANWIVQLPERWRDSSRTWRFGPEGRLAAPLGRSAGLLAAPSQDPALVSFGCLARRRRIIFRSRRCGPGGIEHANRRLAHRRRHRGGAQLGVQLHGPGTVARHQPFGAQ